MAEALDHALARWRVTPTSFVQEVLHDPVTRRPFALLEAERAFLARAFERDERGRLLYPEQCFSAPKKSSKTAFAALHLLTTLLLWGAPYGEAYAIANDQEQAQSRVFAAIKRIVECSPLLKREARITSERIVFPAFADATVSAIASDAASAAGANPVASSFDEVWAFTSERSRRLWDEMVPVPTRATSVRLVTTYAGFSGESLLLEELQRRGLAQPGVGADLHAGDGLLMFWSHAPIAPWQDERWLAEMRRTLRPSAYARLVLNEFVAPESKFVDMSAWDACVAPDSVPAGRDPGLSIWVGVDASTKRDATALVACNFDKQTWTVRLVAHRVFVPGANDPINFEATVVRTLREWREHFTLRKVLFDPFQLVAVAQQLEREGVPVEPYAQTPANLTAATGNLFDLIQARQLVLYPDEGLRLAASRAVISESARGWKLDKLKQQHKIDSIVALSMAALAAVKGADEPWYDTNFARWIGGGSADDEEEQRNARHRAALLEHLRDCGYPIWGA